MRGKPLKKNKVLIQTPQWSFSKTQFKETLTQLQSYGKGCYFTTLTLVQTLHCADVLTMLPCKCSNTAEIV